LNFRGKILLSFVLVIVLFGSILGTYAVKTMYNKVIVAAQEKLKSDLLLSRQYLEEKYPGSWAIVDNNLYKGTTLINQSYSIVDEVGKLTGNTVTIFQGNTRVNTNIIDDKGEWAIGTQVSDVVKQAV